MGWRVCRPVGPGRVVWFGWRSHVDPDRRVVWASRADLAVVFVFASSIVADQFAAAFGGWAERVR